MKTLIMILVSLGVGVGSTLLVQTVIVTPPPVVAVVACPEQRTVVEQAMIEKAAGAVAGRRLRAPRAAPRHTSMSGRKD